MKAWLDKRDREHVICKLCMSDLKYSSYGFQALYQYVEKSKHTNMSSIRFAKNIRHVQVKSGSCSKSSSDD